jgi:urease accessory protein
MTTLTRVVGHETDQELIEVLHELRHKSAVEYLFLAEMDLARKRLRATSDAGREYSLALPREQQLVDGAVVSLTSDGAVVVRARVATRLRLRPVSTTAALRLGFLAGHLHWKVDFENEVLAITQQSATGDYLARVQDLLDAGAVSIVEH